MGLILSDEQDELREIYPSNKGEQVAISWKAPVSQDVYIDVTTTDKGREVKYPLFAYVGGAYTLEVDIERFTPTPTPTPTSSPTHSSDSQQESLYFPLVVGSKWLYDVIEEKEGNKEKTGKIVLEILSEENGVYKATLLRKNVEEHTISRSTMDLTYKSVRNAGFYRDGCLVVPARINNKWSTRLVDTQICNNISKLAGTMETRAECDDDLHTVNVPAERFEDCARTWFELMTIKGVIYGAQEHIEYFAPSVGLVKYEWKRATTVPGSVMGGSVSGTYELTEYNIKPPTQQSVHNLNTGEEFPTIQAAINGSDTKDGHTLTVDAGTYTENVVVNKQLTIRSTSANPADTVVQAKNSNGHVFKVTADYVNISGFTIKHATGPYKAGLYLGTGVDHCNVSDNYVSGNDYGIRLYKSSDNTITNNIASSNSKFGIYLYSSSNNMIYLNDFMNNGDNMHTYKSTNLFNSSSELKYTYNGHTLTNYMGNYWSDYNGNDVDNNGIGDTPYSINSYNDEYPLMESFGYYHYLPQYPDLMVDDIWIKPAEFSPGDEVMLYTRIKNIGDADAVGKFWWNRYIDDTFINNWYKEGLAAGDSKTTYKKYIWPDDCKSHTIKVVVDAKGNISESNEDNNERLEDFTQKPSRG